MNNLLCKQCNNLTSGLINGLCKTCYNKPENAYRDIECLNCNIIFIVNFDTLFCAFCRDKSEVMKNIRTEYIRLKAMEQAAIDLTKEIDNVLNSPKGIAYYFCNQLICEHCKQAQSDYRQLKELLQIN